MKNRIFDIVHIKWSRISSIKYGNDQVWLGTQTFSAQGHLVSEDFPMILSKVGWRRFDTWSLWLAPLKRKNNDLHGEFRIPRK